jgi:lariat debranching enzyme
METPDTITVAVVGCAHGALDTIYKEIRAEENRGKRKIDLLICCGDFECARNEADLAFMEGPAKFKVLKDFHKYYSGAATAPVLTLFVGTCWASAYLERRQP